MEWVVLVAIAGIGYVLWKRSKGSASRVSEVAAPPQAEAAQKRDEKPIPQGIKSNDLRTWPIPSDMTPEEKKYFDDASRDLKLSIASVDLDDFRDGDLLNSFPNNLGGAARTLLELWDEPMGLRPDERLHSIIFFSRLQKRDWDGAKEVLTDVMIPNAPPDVAEGLLYGTNQWATADELEKAGYPVCENVWAVPGAVSLGQIRKKGRTGGSIKLPGPSHVLMFATTESGKNQRFIFENLMTYDGPLVCLDPKGENYDRSAAARQAHGRIFKFAPWDSDSDCFNPLDFVQDYDDCFVLANLLVPKPTWGEKFWTETAQAITAGLIFYLKKCAPPEKQHMEELLDLFNLPAQDMDNFVFDMMEHEIKEIRRLGNNIRDLDDKMRKSIWQTGRTELNAWASPRIANVTRTTSQGLNPTEIVERARLSEREGDDVDVEDRQGGTDSVYICVPPDKIVPYAQLLRVVFGMMLVQLTKKLPVHERDAPPRRSFLFLIDEVAQLGYMDILERMMPIARGYDLRLWLVFQNIGQLKEKYPESGSILENAHAQVFFGDMRAETAAYLSKELGNRTDIHGRVTPAVPPSDLSGPAFEGKAFVRLRRVRPVLAHLPQMFDQSEAWSKVRKQFEERWQPVLLRERAERPKDDPILAAARLNGSMRGINPTKETPT